jgi:hypothetical protein
MEGFSWNENTLIHIEEYEIFLNKVKCEDEVMEETWGNPSLQTKDNRISKY